MRAVHGWLAPPADAWRQGSARAQPRLGAGRRIRVLIVITSTAGGAGQLVFSLAARLPRDRFEVHVMFGPGYPLDEAFDRLGIGVTRIALARGLAPAATAKGFAQVLAEMRRCSYDVVCGTCSTAGMVARLAGWLVGVPHRVLIVQVYAALPHHGAFKRFAFGSIERALDRVTTAYVAVSDATKQFGVAQGIMAPEKVRVIHNGVEMADAASGSAAALRRSLGIDGCPVVGFLGRLEAQKGLPFLIEAAEAVRSAVPRVRFVIFGDGPLLAALKQDVAKRGLTGTVLFAGWYADTATALASMDVLCLPSLWEQFPLAVLEAMMVGRPVVATSVDGVQEAVVDGATGLLVPPREPDSLARALIRLLDQPEFARALGEAGRERARERFGLARMVESYAMFLSDLVVGSALPRAAATENEKT